MLRRAKKYLLLPLRRQTQAEGSQTCNVWNHEHQDSRSEGAPEYSARVSNAEYIRLTVPDVARLATFFMPLARLKKKFCVTTASKPKLTRRQLLAVLAIICVCLACALIAQR